METVKYFSVLCHPVQIQAIDRLQRATGIVVEHHHSVPGFLRACTDCEKAIVFVRWRTSESKRSARTISEVRSKMPHGVYLIALSRSYSEMDMEKSSEAGIDRLVQTDISTPIFTGLINAITRRLESFGSVYHFPPYTLNLNTRTVSLANMSIQLTPREFRLVQYLFEGRGCALTRTAFLRDVWGLPELHCSRRVDTKICHIRAKLKFDGTYGWLLAHSRGQGYVLYKST